MLVDTHCSQESDSYHSLYGSEGLNTCVECSRDVGWGVVGMWGGRPALQPCGGGMPGSRRPLGV